MSSAYEGGLRSEDVARQHAEIDEVNARVGDIRVLKGVEADILPDGTLDYGPDVLDRFDFVIGSIHSRFGMAEAEMTRRVLTARTRSIWSRCSPRPPRLASPWRSTRIRTG